MDNTDKKTIVSGDILEFFVLYILNTIIRLICLSIVVIIGTFYNILVFFIVYKMTIIYPTVNTIYNLTTGCPLYNTTCSDENKIHIYYNKGFNSIFIYSLIIACLEILIYLPCLYIINLLSSYVYVNILCYYYTGSLCNNEKIIINNQDQTGNEEHPYDAKHVNNDYDDTNTTHLDNVMDTNFDSDTGSDFF